MSPMVDGWKGDDWFHNGAFRQTNFDYIYGQTARKDDSLRVPRGAFDDYANFLKYGSAGDYGRHFGFGQLGFWNKLVEHPAYDAYWQGQALDPVMAAQPLEVPRMIVASLWDQEDMYGAIATYEAVEPKDAANDRNFLVLGPWRHSGVNYDGSVLGALKFDGDTALRFRRDVMKPFLDSYLRTVRRRRIRRRCSSTKPARTAGGASRAGRSPARRAAPRYRSRSGCMRAARSISHAPTAPRTTSTSPIRPSRYRTSRVPCTSRTATRGAAGSSSTSASSTAVRTC
jgi:predicted acyl esterase